VKAATDLEQAIEQNEHLVRSLHGCALDSEKGIVRAAELARQTAASQAQVGVHVQTLLQAIQVTRERNLAAVEEANECVGRIDERSEALKALVERFAEIGGNAREINELAQGLRATVEGDEAGRLARIDAVLERMCAVRDEARALATLARDQGFTDVFGQADALAQQLASLQNKLRLFADKLR
jgi:hypothetical protein